MVDWFGMDKGRRKLLRAAVAAALLPQAGGLGLFVPEEARAAFNCGSPINVIMPPDYAPPVEGDAAHDFQMRLGKATLDFVRDSYQARPLPVWNKPLAQVDLGKRIFNIAYWVLDGVRKGWQTIEYRMRAAFPGSYHAMPARVYNMYQPGLFAASRELEFEIR